MENTEASTTTTNAEGAVLVFKDQAGEYYLLPQERLEQGRVAAEHKAEVERLLTEPNDVAGHLFFLGVIVGVAIGGATAVATIAHHQSQEGGTMTNAQYFEQVTGQKFPGRQ
jgi:hypothetical protein